MGKLTFLSVTNLVRYQHYKKRNPPWVKLHRQFWDDGKIELLTVPERLLFLGCLTLASESQNHFPNNPRWITKRLSMSVRPAMIRKLLSLHLLTVSTVSTAPSVSDTLSSVSDTLSLSKQTASKPLANR